MVIATAIALGSLAVSVFSLFNNLGQQARQNRIDLQADLAENEVSTQQTEAQITGWEQFLEAAPVAGEALKGSTGDLEFDTNYRQMLENFGNTNVLAGMRGGVAAGTTGQAVSAQSKDIMSSYVDVERKKAEAQLDILGTTLDTLGETRDVLEDTSTYRQQQRRNAFEARRAARRGTAPVPA